MAKRTTIRDVALRAGVSTATVDRVLNGRGGVRLDREIRVLEAAKALQATNDPKAVYARQLRIAVILQSASDPLHAYLQKILIDTAQQHRLLNIHYYVHHFELSDEKAIAQFLYKAEKEYDGIIASLPDVREVRKQIEKLTAIMPVVLLLTDISGINRRAYVGIDNFQAGRVVGHMMGRFLGRELAAVICVSGFNSMPAHAQRCEGFQSSIKEEFKNLHVINIDDKTHDDVNRAAELVYHYMKLYPSIRGVYNASAGANTIVEAIKKLGRTSDTVFITHELTPDRSSLLQSGLIDAIIDQDPEAQIKAATEIMASHFHRLTHDRLSRPTLFRVFMPGMIPKNSEELEIL